jgi:hypothetical protein|tara:strand:- start:457 stop:669 length:213 start_codon:yes stop_codon:yes gene_type:complete
MNDVTVFIFGIGFALTAGAAFAFMWKSMSMVQEELRKPQRNVHPEMKEVQNGEELLVFKVKDDNSTDYNS